MNKRLAWGVGGAVAAAVLAIGVAGALWAQRAGPAKGASSAALGAGAGASSPGAAASAPPLVFRANEVVQPVLASLPQLIEFSGPLVAPNTAVVRAKASGTLVSLTVGGGARVAAGQPLGRIDMAELGSRIAERSAQTDAMRAAMVQAERSHAANERLAAQNFISSTALDSSRAALDSARANLQAAQASMDTTRVAQRDGQLVAPIAGIVAKRHALPGEKVAVEQQLLTLVNLQGLELAGTVGTHEVARLAPGQPVQVQVEGMPTPVNARLLRIAPAAEPGTRAIGVTVALPNADEKLRAGQYAVARVVLPDDKQRLVLPLAAVGSTSGQTHVWTIDSGKLVRRAVTLGQRDEATGRVEVLGGLARDATVLGARFDNLREGGLASVSAGPAAAVASASASAQVTR